MGLCHHIAHRIVTQRPYGRTSELTKDAILGKEGEHAESSEARTAESGRHLLTSSLTSSDGQADH